jgi:hypothetical protein
MAKVFISFSTQNDTLCRDIRVLFEASGVSTWNHTTLVAGYPLANQLRKAIDESEVCVFLATKEAMASGWCLAEVGAFWGAGKPVIVFTEDADFDEMALPPQFRGDLRAMNRDKLKEAIQHHLPPLLPQPERPAAVLLNLSVERIDRAKRQAICATFPKLGTAEEPICVVNDDWDALTRD